MRKKITALATLVVIAVLVMASIGLVLSERRLLTNNLDESISTRVDEIEELVKEGRVPPTLTGLGEDDAVGQVILSGKVVATSANTLCTGSTPVLNNALRIFSTATLGNFTAAGTTGAPLTLSGTATQIASGTGSNTVTLTYRHIPSTSDQLTAGCPYTLTDTVALAASVASLAFTGLAAWTRPEVNTAWVPSLGLRWHFAVDGIGVPLVLLTALLTVAVVVQSRGREPAGGSAATFYACILLVEFGALATFLTRDAIGFFIAFELVLVPMWALINRFGDEHQSEAVRADASYRFIFFTALGSTLMLIGIIALVSATGTSDLTALASARGGGMDRHTQVLIAALLVAGLGIKVPLWPAHTWLPPAHTVAPTAGSVLLAAVLLKMGTYGIVRVAMPTVPEGFAAVAPYLAAAGTVGILWGALACLVERDLKRLVAYSSVAHMGFVALGLASGTETGLQAALFANIAHGLVSALLFFVVGALKQRWGSADLGVPRSALRESAPRLGFALVVGFAAAFGLPGLAGFWGEFPAILSAYQPAVGLSEAVFRTYMVVAAIGTVLAAGYLLWMFQRTAFGTPKEEFAKAHVHDVHPLEWVAWAPMLALIFVLGVYPRLIFGITNEAVNTMSQAFRAVGG